MLDFSSLLKSQFQIENVDQELGLKLIPGPKYVQVERRVSVARNEIDFSLGAFNNYVDQILPNFDHLPFVHMTKHGLSNDHLPTSSYPSSY